jgi:deoxyribose-phosphate aldolase
MTTQTKELTCQPVIKVDTDYVRTLTGLSCGGATVADVNRMRRTVLGVSAGLKIAVEAQSL